MTAREVRRRAFEARIGRWLIAVTYLSVGLLVAGVALMVSGGISPLAGGPALDLGAVLDGLTRLDPSAFLWLGLLAVIATPVTRVVAAAVGFARTGEWLLVLAALGILITILASIGSVALPLAVEAGR
jgi:uncharacterized membrane protein